MMQNDRFNFSIIKNNFEVKLAETADELASIQRLRYSVFCEEYGANSGEEIKKTKRLADKFDDFSDHIIVLDHQREKPLLVGGYRVMRKEGALLAGGFLTSEEFDISKLLSKPYNILELSRACVAKKYRMTRGAELLWHGIARYIDHYNIDYMFGCASFQGTNHEKITRELSYLQLFYPADPAIAPVPLSKNQVPIKWHDKNELDEKTILPRIPALIRAYIRLQCGFGTGAVIDPIFKTIDVCLIVHTNKIKAKYFKYYLQKNAP